MQPASKKVTPQRIDFSFQLVHAFFIGLDLLLRGNAHRPEGILDVSPDRTRNLVLGLDDPRNCLCKPPVVDQLVERCRLEDLPDDVFL